MRTSTCICLLLVLKAILDTSCFNLIMEKSYQQVPSKESFTILCQADVPLTVCQIKRYLNLNVFLDLSLGNATPPLAAVSYAGTGLESGQCGVTIKKPSVAGGYNVYGCRARSVGGGWKHGVTVIDVSDGTYWTLPVVSGPETVLADPESNVTISFATGGPLNFCNFKWPGLGNWTRAGDDNTYMIDNSELDEGKCQLTLFNVSAATSGFILTDIRSKYRIKGKRGDYIHVTTLVVKELPSLPLLTMNVDSDILNATCSVGAARPTAHITWLFGDEIIRNDLLDDEDSGSEWSWEFDAKSMTQNVFRKLSEADDGKELLCRVEHIALPGGRAEAKEIISVKGLHLFHLPKHITWLLMGIGASFLFILTSWGIYACVTRKRRRKNAVLEDDRSSPIYDDINLNMGKGLEEDQSSHTYDDVNLNLTKGSVDEYLKPITHHLEMNVRRSNTYENSTGSNSQTFF